MGQWWILVLSLLALWAFESANARRRRGWHWESDGGAKVCGRGSNKVGRCDDNADVDAGDEPLCHQDVFKWFQCLKTQRIWPNRAVTKHLRHGRFEEGLACLDDMYANQELSELSDSKRASRNWDERDDECMERAETCGVDPFLTLDEQEVEKEKCR